MRGAVNLACTVVSAFVLALYFKQVRCTASRARFTSHTSTRYLHPYIYTGHRGHVALDPSHRAAALPDPRCAAASLERLDRLRARARARVSRASRARVGMSRDARAPTNDHHQPSPGARLPLKLWRAVVAIPLQRLRLVEETRLPPTSRPAEPPLRRQSSRVGSCRSTPPC